MEDKTANVCSAHAHVQKLIAYLPILLLVGDEGMACEGGGGLSGI